MKHARSRFFCFTFFCSVFFLPAQLFAQTPVLRGEADAYPRRADEFSSAVVIDMASRKELYVVSPDSAWPAASLTKLLSALVVAERKPNWNRVISLKASDEVGGGRLRVRPGARLTVRDLLSVSIVGSANNTANALARSSGLSRKRFAAEMNRTAKRLKMNASSFVDPSGISSKNISTARDLAKLAHAAFANQRIREAAASASYSFTLRKPRIQKTIVNTNRLLTSENEFLVFGGKTGYLEESRHNVVVALQGRPKDPKKPKLLIVVLGAPDKSSLFASAAGLANWAWNAYEWGT